MPAFDNLVAARKSWIAEVLIPWCQTAPRSELLRAEQDWTDLAGRVAPEHSLWLWAWGRFPPLHVDGLKGLDETYELEVTLRDGRTCRGFPDARRSQRGELWLQGRELAGPFSLDDIENVSRV